NEIGFFEELGGRKRKVELNGRCAPIDVIKFGREQRHEITWNPGSPDATLQVSGSSKKPISFKGVWRDRYMLGDNPEGIARIGQTNGGTGSQVASAFDLCTLFEAICDQGQQVRFSWGRVVFFGIIGEFEW